MSETQNITDKIKNAETASEFTDSEYEKIMELVGLCKEEQVFSIEGTMYLGNRVDVVKAYVKQRPSDKFIIWVDKNYPLLML